MLKLLRQAGLGLGIAVVMGCSGPKQISFPTQDGGIVFADVYGEGDRTVVLAHGGQFNKESWAEQAKIFAETGFRVVAIDFRGRGRSRAGPQSSDEEDAYLDVLAAVEYAHDEFSETVFVVGASFGGSAAAQAAVASPGKIDRLVLLAAPVDNPERLTGRVLFILTRNDFSGNGRLRLPDIQEQYDRVHAPKDLVILEGSAHAQHIFKTYQSERLMQEILRFFSEN